MYGKSHTPETLALMSEAKTGVLNPMHGKVPANAFPSGANNPMHGKVAANAITVYVYSLEYVLVQTFSSMTAAAEFLNTSKVQVHRYIRSGKVFQSKYLISTTILSK